MPFLLTSDSFPNAFNNEVFQENKSIKLEKHGFTVQYSNLDEADFEDRVILTDGNLDHISESVKDHGREFTKHLDCSYTALLLQRKKQLKLYRDQFGSQPIYYIQRKGQIAVSDRIKPLTDISGAELNRDVALDYLKHGLVDHRRETFFKNIKTLRPGKALKFSKGKLTVFSPDYSKKDSRSLQETITGEIEDKIPDKKFVCPVSGGLDSAIVASMSTDREVDFVHASFNQSTGDETFFRSVEEEYRIDVETVNFSADTLLRSIEETLVHQEEPTGLLAVQAQDKMYQWIKQEKGDSIILQGTGADELFYGYPKFIPYYINEKFSEGLTSGLRSFLRYRTQLNSFEKREVLRLITKGVYSSTDPKTSVFCAENRSYTRPEGLEEIQRMHLERFYLPHILRSISKSSSKYGHEVRSAFLSKSMKSKAEKLGGANHFGNGKTKKILRELFRDNLPDSVYDRKKKTGFIHMDNMYYNETVTQELEEVFGSTAFQSRSLYNGEKILSSLKKDELNFWEAYRYYTFEKWMRMYIDGSG